MTTTNKNLIGVSGKIGSGKDTVGKIIQWLTSKNTRMLWEGDINVYLQNSDKYPDNDNKYQIKKFAFKVKQIASLLTGIPVEDFEKQEVKDSRLPEIWHKFDENNHYLEPDTVRELLQKIGTDAIRNIIHPDAWVNALFADYDKRLGNSTYCTFCYGENYVVGNVPNWKCPKHPNVRTVYIPPFPKPSWIITDTRFPNELKAIKDRNGITIRVNRLTGRQIDIASTYFQNGVKPIIEHPSETALDKAEFDYVIDNNSDIQSLIEKVREIIIKEKII